MSVMSVRVKYEPAPIAGTVEASYRRDDFALTYLHRPSESPDLPMLRDVIEERLGIRRGISVLVIADTLVLTFRTEAKQLIALDAYTNWEHWKRVPELKVPPIAGLGRVCLTERVDDDRMSLAVVPEYVYSRKQRLLCLRLAFSREETSYYRASSQLLVGISGDVLTELLIENLAII